MQRIKDEFIEKIDAVISLSNKNVLEIGSGNGARSAQIASKCKHLTGVEPDPALVRGAQQNNAGDGVEYVQGQAEKLIFADNSFDAAIFTLSLHHVPVEKMPSAIDEAVRVTRQEGFVVFLEPTEKGNFFEAEIMFDACDGDERVEKRAAYQAMQFCDRYKAVTEMLDETVFKFDSLEDFISTMNPTRNVETLDGFLRDNDFVLRAQRRINIFRV